MKEKVNATKSRSKLLVALMFIIFFMLTTSIISGYMRSNTQYIYPGSFVTDGSWKVDRSMCEAGQDFIIQIAPFGCTPAVVRSDLLEEQNVPVFCQLAATKMNPLIDVKAIESISFSGNYPEGVQGIGFHPARSALGVKGDLNSPVLNNIGYAVIVLKEQKNASAMPEFIKGNLTAKLKYDIENAYGIGKVNFYLPEVGDDSNWEDIHKQYGFWNSRGYLRAEDIETDKATISVYDDTKKISSVTLKKGETSKDIYLPGFDCLAGLKIKLNGLEDPDTRVRLNINGELVEVKEGEKFLENDCSIIRNGIDKQGLIQKVSIKCKTDEGRESFDLSVSPKVRLEICNKDGIDCDGGKEYSFGDYLYDSDNSKFIYLGYVGAKLGSESLDIYLVAIPEQRSKLTEEELSFTSRIANQYSGEDINVFKRYAKYVSASVQNFYGWVKDGESYRNIVQGTPEKFKGKIVSISGVSSPQDRALKEGEAKDYYEAAMSDYETLVDTYSKIQENPSVENGITYGEDSFFESIALSDLIDQKERMSELCDEFKEEYPNSNLVDILHSDNGICGNEYRKANSEIPSRTLSINGKVKTITFEKIIEPTKEEYSAEVNVVTPRGKPIPVVLKNDETIYLDDLRNESEMMFSVDRGKFTTTIYFKFDKKWRWSPDLSNWVSAPETEVKKGFFNLKILGGEVFSLNENNKKLIEDLGDKNFEDGKKLITNKDNGGSEWGNDYIKLVKIIDEETAKIEVYLRPTGILDASEKVIMPIKSLTLKKGVAKGESGYSFNLLNVNLKRMAKVTLKPSISNEGTEANFSFKIGIEQRAIKLSPEKTKEKIKNLNNSIKEWEERSEDLGKFVKGMKGACLATEAFLTVKNLISNTGGKAIARKEVMNTKWYSKCDNLVNEGDYSSREECLLDKSKEIESDVEDYAKSIEDYNAIAKKLNEKYSEEGSILDILGQKGVDTKGVMSELYPQIKNKLSDRVNITCKDGSKDRTIPLDSESTIYKAFNVTKEGSLVYIEDARDIYTLLDMADKDESYKNKLCSRLIELEENSEEVVEIQSLGGELKSNGLEGVDVSIGKEKDSQDVKFKGKVFNQNVFGTGIMKGNLIHGFVYSSESISGEKWLLKLNKNKGNEYIVDDIFTFKGGEVDDSIKQTLISEINSKYSFTRYDSSSYSNPFISVAGEGRTGAVVKYYETEPYKGLPALVPFDVEQGWYVTTKQTLPVFGNIGAYQDSGRVSSMTVCNVGQNGIAEFFSGINDDICRTVNLGTGEAYNQFPGLDTKEAKKIIDCAVDAINKASNADKNSERIIIKTNCGKVKAYVGRPAVDVPEMQCSDFMSVEDCQWMFNVCDPVICPSSRCDFGGAYPVKDVIQSGIIGSLALCLPNYKEGIYIPICLSGVKAGIDNWVTIMKSHRDCLQESLDTGQMIGICDEIYSIHKCEFFWRQALPLTKMIIPKLMEVMLGQNVRGGGEYLGVKSAWENAGKSVDYFTQYYAANSYKAFKARSTEEVGGEICKASVSGVYPSGGNLLDTLTEPDSPPQFTGWLHEIPFTTATNPPISQYKVYYHISAGKDSRAYYSVYLKGDQESSYYQDTGDRYNVASGYIKTGDYASETRDFTAPSGYRELCIVVNGQEECGFKEVSTSFALDWISDQAVKEQAERTDITSEKECVSGSTSVYSLLSPNIQEGVDDAVNPAIYDMGIIRICSTDDPGKGSDNQAIEKRRWIRVGYCDDNKEMKCWMDRESIKDAVVFNSTAGDILKKQTENYMNSLRSEGDYLEGTKFKKEVKEIEDEGDLVTKINRISDIIDKVFWDYDKAKLFLLRANTYGELAINLYEPIKREETDAEVKEEDKTCNDFCIASGLSRGKLLPKEECITLSKELYTQDVDCCCYRSEEEIRKEIDKITPFVDPSIGGKWLTVKTPSGEEQQVLFEDYNKKEMTVKFFEKTYKVEEIINGVLILGDEVIKTTFSKEEQSLIDYANSCEDCQNSGGDVTCVKEICEAIKDKHKLYCISQDKSAFEGVSCVTITRCEDCGNGIDICDAEECNMISNLQGFSCKIEDNWYDIGRSVSCKTDLSDGTKKEEWTLETTLKKVDSLMRQFGESAKYSQYYEIKEFIDQLHDQKNPLLSDDEYKEINGEGFWNNLEENLRFVKNLLITKQGDDEEDEKEKEEPVEERKTSYDFKSRTEKNMIDAINYASKKNFVSPIKGYGSNEAQIRSCKCDDKCASYAGLIVDASNDNDISDPLLLLAIMMRENNCGKGTIENPSIGLMQINTEGKYSNCGRYGLPSASTECKKILLNNPSKNIDVGAQILEEKHTSYKDGHVLYPSSGDCGRKVEYINWEAAVRGYVGYGCTAGHDDYVEHVMSMYQELSDYLDSQ